MGWGKILFDAVTGGVFDADEVNACENEYFEGREDGYEDGYQDGRETEQAIQADIDRANQEIMERAQSSSEEE